LKEKYMSSGEGRPVADAHLIHTAQWVVNIESTIARSASDVWPVFKDMKRWYTEYSFEVVSGPPYRAGLGLLEGQVLKVKSSRGPLGEPDEDAPGPHYYIVKVIKVSAHNEMVVVLSGSAYDFKQYTQFYVWKITEKAGKSTILIDAYGEAEFFTPLPKGELPEFHNSLDKNFHRSWSEAFVGLQKVMDEIR
jgi:hypothetical protein